MKLLQIIKEEIVPLSKKQNIVLLTIIACIFQFALFYAPALADQAVQEANAQGIGQETIISNDSVVKETSMDPEAAKLSIAIAPATTSSSVQAATTTPMASSSVQVATTTPKVDKVVTESSRVMTAYNSEAGQTDDSPCITANGFDVCKHGVEDTIAANFLPLGTKVKIPDLFGDRVFVVRDRMNKKHASRVDVWMKDRHDAINFGVKVAKIQVLE